MKFWSVIKGNKSVRDILINDKDGNAISTLSDVTEIKFQIKENKTDDPLVEKTSHPAVGIEINTPDPGYLRITLLPDDTGVKLDIGDYYMALQIKWSDTDVYEVRIEIDGEATNKFIVNQDIIQ